MSNDPITWGRLLELQKTAHEIHEDVARFAQSVESFNNATTTQTKTLLWLTWTIAFLTLVMAIEAGVQIALACG